MYGRNYNRPRTKKYVGVETLDNNMNRDWYYIPGFNGYEFSNDGYVRSMKHFRKYPYGILIKPKINNKTGQISCPEDPIFEMSDSNNIRKQLHRSEIEELVRSGLGRFPGYPRKTYISNRSSRNQSCCVNKPYQQFSQQRFYPQFNIIPEQQPMNNIQLFNYNGQPVCPIEFYNNN